MAETNKLSIIALVLSLIFFIPFAPLIGLIMGIVALVKINKSGEEGKGFAIGAIVAGSLITILHLLFLVVLIGAVFFVSSSFTEISDANIVDAKAICEEKSAGFSDACHIINMGVHQDEIPADYCDDIEFVDEDLQNMCLAMAKKDVSYCEKISDSNSRNDCIESVAAMQGNII